MDFELTLDDKIEVFEQYTEVMACINNKLAHWNNFYPEKEVIIKVKKVPGQTPTLGIGISDAVETKEEIH